jgi:isopenicillin N synthase-like dioxygenase
MMQQQFPTEDGHPVIDCRPLLLAEGDAESTAARMAALRQLRAALTLRGYFYCSVGVALPQELIARTYEQSKLAHALPLELLRTRYVGALAPYRGFSANEPNYDASIASLCHSWDFGRDVPRLPVGDPDYEYCGPNVYPDTELPQLRGVVDELYEKQDALARMMFRAFAEMFELPNSTFSQHFSWRSSSSLRLLWYPGSDSAIAATAAAAASASSGSQAALPTSGISPHTDFELFTLMSQDAPGLQIIPRQSNPTEASASSGDGAWIDLPVRSGEFVIIVGDMLERYTNGALKATPHRVQMVPWERRSIIRFVAVDGATVVAPLPEFVPTGTEPRYTAVQQVQHVVSTLQAVREGVGSWAGGAGGRSLSASAVYEAGAYDAVREKYNAQFGQVSGDEEEQERKERGRVVSKL